MMWFWPAVQMREIVSGHTYFVKVVEQMETWPPPDSGKRGTKWRKAYKTCFDALEGTWPRLTLPGRPSRPRQRSRRAPQHCPIERESKLALKPPSTRGTDGASKRPIVGAIDLATCFVMGHLDQQREKLIFRNPRQVQSDLQWKRPCDCSMAEIPRNSKGYAKVVIPSLIHRHS